GEVAADGVVPRLPPQPGAVRPAARGGVQSGLRAAGRPVRARETAGRAVPDSEAHELFDLPPMSTTERDSGFGIRDSHGEPGNRGSHGAGSGRPNSSESRPRTPDSRFFWRTLEERLGDPDFQRHLCNEFPSLLPTIEQVADPVARRTFLKLMGASLALAGVSA